jgi:hypothetical protein
VTMHQASAAQPAYHLRPLGAPMGVRNTEKPAAVRPPAVRTIVNGAPVEKA